MDSGGRESEFDGIPKDSIQVAVWQALGSRDGQEVVSADAF